MTVTLGPTGAFSVLRDALPDPDGTLAVSSVVSLGNVDGNGELTRSSRRAKASLSGWVGPAAISVNRYSMAAMGKRWVIMSPKGQRAGSISMVTGSATLCRWAIPAMASVNEY